MNGKGQRSYTQLHGKLNLIIVTYLIFTYKLCACQLSIMYFIYFYLI